MPCFNYLPNRNWCEALNEKCNHDGENECCELCDYAKDVLLGG
jgi:hypothetical protein